MAYFNHAFSKAFLAKTHEQTNTQTSADLSVVGEFAVLASDFGIMAAADVANNKGGFYLAQAAFQTNDKIGNNPGMGGYKESSKSKMIMSKYISDMWISDCTNEVANIGQLLIKATGDDLSCFPCDTQPMFRVDIKGAAALRFLNHNAYATLNGSLPMPAVNAQDGTGALVFSTAVQDNGVDMCCGTQTAGTAAGIAPSIVAINLRDQFNNDPILKQFATAKLYVSINAGSSFAGVSKAQEQFIYNGGALGVSDNIAGATTGTVGDWGVGDQYRIDFEMKTSCALQTQFGDCSFDTRDHYEKEPVSLIFSFLDETGNPCSDCGTSVSSPGQMAQTSGETVLRSLLLTERYAQNPFNQGNRDSSRIREIEGFDPILDAVTRTKLYRVYYLQHSVPRLNNPSGVFDNDQYLYQVFVDEDNGTLVTAMDGLWAAIEAQCIAVGNYLVESTDSL